MGARPGGVFVSRLCLYLFKGDSSASVMALVAVVVRQER